MIYANLNIIIYRRTYLTQELILYIDILISIIFKWLRYLLITRQIHSSPILLSIKISLIAFKGLNTRKIKLQL
jgi:hypothetical protein